MDYRQIPIDLKLSPYDSRDFKVGAVGVVQTETFPREYTIPYVPDPRNQKSTNMCLAFTLAKLKEYQEWKERGRVKKYSPGFIYSYRVYGSEGMYMRVGMNILRKYGVCEEELFPNIGTYDDLREEFLEVKDSLIAEAVPQRISKYARAFSTDEVKRSLIDNGAMAMAITINKNFYDEVDGVIPMPDGNIVGGHGVLLVGWKEVFGKTHWDFSNSWGDEWGNKGRGLIPIGYPGLEFWTCIDEQANKNQGKQVVMTIGEKKYTVNGVQKEMRLAPFTKFVEELGGDVTFVPIREAGESLGAEVVWTPVNPNRIEINL